MQIPFTTPTLPSTIAAYSKAREPRIEPSVSCFYDSIMRMGRDCDIMLDTWDITRKVSYRHKWICPLFAQLILQ